MQSVQGSEYASLACRSVRTGECRQACAASWSLEGQGMGAACAPCKDLVCDGPQRPGIHSWGGCHGRRTVLLCHHQLCTHPCHALVSHLAHGIMCLQQVTICQSAAASHCLAGRNDGLWRAATHLRHVTHDRDNESKTSSKGFHAQRQTPRTDMLVM